MQFLLRFLIIALVSFAGELLNYLIPLSVPGSIYGFIIMLILLLTKVIKLDYIKPVSDFLLNVMPVTFIAPGVALITVLSELESILLPLLITVTLSTAVVMGVVGIVVEKIVKRGDR